MTVAERRVSKQPDRGVIALNYVVSNQQGDEVMTFSVTLMVRRAVEAEPASGMAPHAG